MGPYVRWIILSCSGILSLIVLISWNGNDLWGKPLFAKKQSRKLIETARGIKTHKELSESVFEPLGYKIKEETFVPALDYTHEQECSKVFSQWLAAGSETQDESATPPKEIPHELVDKYTLNNYTLLIMAPFWRDERSGIRTDTWSESRINDLIQLDINDPSLDKYDGEGRGMYYAMKEHSVSVTGKPGVVIGSTKPWVEIFALQLNTSHVTTIEYMKILMEHPKMSYEHPVQIAKDYSRHVEAYDWIATFSSLEHSGLGRYGDALDPFGDLKESLKMYCMLKKGGYLFLGLPVGYDAIYFNWHRVYGRIRLALMTAGFDLVEVFYKESRLPIEGIDFTEGEPGAHIQPVVVLRKR